MEWGVGCCDREAPCVCSVKPPHLACCAGTKRQMTRAAHPLFNVTQAASRHLDALVLDPLGSVVYHGVPPPPSQSPTTTTTSISCDAWWWSQLKDTIQRFTSRGLLRADAAEGTHTVLGCIPSHELCYACDVHLHHPDTVKPFFEAFGCDFHGMMWCLTMLHLTKTEILPWSTSPFPLAFPVMKGKFLPLLLWESSWNAPLMSPLVSL